MSEPRYPVTAYRVVIADGPAEGHEYVTFVPPDPVIVLAPQLGDAEKHGRWMRVVGIEPGAGESDEAARSWPGSVRYACAPLPLDDKVFEGAEDVEIYYRELT